MSDRVGSVRRATLRQVRQAFGMRTGRGQAVVTPASGARGEASRPPLQPARLVLIVFTALAVALMLREVADSGVATLAPGARQLAVLATDGLVVREVDGDTGTEARRLLELPATSAERIVALAPRPGAIDGTPLVALSQSPGGARLWWLDDDGRRQDFAEGLTPRVQPSALRRAVPAPVWSPDGAWLAWLDPDPAGTLLRVLAWNPSGPRADDPRHLTVRLRGAFGPGARLESWHWLDDAASQAVLTVSDDRPALWEFDLAQRGGQLSLEQDRARRLPGSVVDRADAEVSPGRPPWPRWLLLRQPDVERAPMPQLRWLAGGGEGGTVPLPPRLEGNPAHWWLDAYRSLLVVGDGRLAWVVHLDGSTVRLAGDVRHAVPLQRIDERWEAQRRPVPAGPARRLE